MVKSLTVKSLRTSINDLEGGEGVLYPKPDKTDGLIFKCPECMNVMVCKGSFDVPSLSLLQPQKCESHAFGIGCGHSFTVQNGLIEDA